MSPRCVALLALVLVAACQSADRAASAGTSTSAPAGAPAPPALAAGQRCLPAMICDDWVGCALVAGDKVVSADRLPAGQPVTIDNACTTGATCIAARALPAGVVCAPHTVPPLIAPPPYTCVWDGKICSKR